MPEKPFTVNIYKVVVHDDDERQFRMMDNSFSAAIEASCAASFADKNKDVDGKMRRLEHYTQHGDFHLLNFATAAFDGPGHFSQTTQVAPFGIDPDEYFAHETAMLYDPDQHLAFLESSQRGMSRTTVARYFMRFAPPKTRYELLPVLDDEASARARRYKTIRKLEVSAALHGVSAAD